MAHDSKLPPGSILLRTMALIVPRYGGALLFMAVHARCSDRSSLLSLFSFPPVTLRSTPRVLPPVSLSSLLSTVRNRGIKRMENRRVITVRDVSYGREQMLSQFIFDDAKSSCLLSIALRIGNRSTFLRLNVK